MGFAVGVMGLSRDTFEWMTPAEFSQCAELWRKEKEREVHLAYELQRFNSWLGLAPYVDISRKSQEDIYPFPWEKQKTAKIKVAKVNGETNSISKIKSATRR